MFNKYLTGTAQAQPAHPTLKDEGENVRVQNHS